MPAPELATARLLLRGWRESDLEPFAAINADPEVMRFLGRPLSAAASDALVARIVEHFARHGFGLWAVELRDGGELAGFVGLSIPRFEASFTPCVEIGWRLGRAFWGRGIATEAAREALRFGFLEADLAEIVSFTVPANARSRSVMERLGMRRDLDADFEHPAMPAGHPLRLHLLYRLEREAWKVGR
jgi:RimJ/RimL family protein N-acetyltransferase